LKKILMHIFVAVMNFFYMFIKLAPAKNKVTFISRQSDRPSLDLRMLGERLAGEGNIEVVILARKLGKTPGAMIGYFFHMFRQMYCIATSQVVLVDSYCIMVSILHHKKNLKVIQIWHAVSAIKKFGHQTVGRPDGSSESMARIMHMHDNYDYVACSSDVTADYFCQGFGVDRDSIVKLGLPRIDYILADKEMVRNKLLDRYPVLRTGPTILYVPTFRKGRKVDVKSIADSAGGRYNLVVKLHPLDKESVDRSTADPRLIFEEEFNTYDLLSIADFVISDYSSFVVEASLTGKPLFLYTYDREEYAGLNGLNVDYGCEAIGKYAFDDARALIRALDQDYDHEALESFCNKYIDIDREDCTGQMADFLRRLMDGYKKEN